MGSEHQFADLIVLIDAGEDADSEELDFLTRQLRSELQDLEVESVDLLRGDALPEGTKSAEAITLGALAVTLLPALTPKLIDFVQAWSMRGESRSVRIKTQVGERFLEVEYSPSTMSKKELKDLVDMLTGALGNQNT